MAVIHSQNPLASFSRPLSRATSKGESVRPAPSDPSISPSSRVRLTDTLCAIAEGVDGVLNTPIGVNHASLSLVSALDNAGRWLGLEIRLANLAAVFESTDWSNVDVETVVMALGVAQRRRMLNQKQDSLVASTIARSVAGEQSSRLLVERSARQSDPLRQTVRLLDKSQVGQTLEEVARAVVTKCSKGAIWLLCELLELDTPGESMNCSWESNHQRYEMLFGIKAPTSCRRSSLLRFSPLCVAFCIAT